MLKDLTRKGPLSIHMPQRWDQRLQTSQRETELRETELAFHRASSIFLTASPREVISPVLLPLYSGRIMVLFYGYIYGFIMVFASFKVWFFFFPCRYVFACLPDILHFQLSLRGTPSFPGHQTPWMLMVQNLIFFKGISNTLLSYFGCRASRKWLKMVLLLKYQVP